MEFIANLSNSRTRYGIDKASLEWLEKLFRDTVGDQKEIKQDEFKKIVTSKNPFFTERVFQIFDRDNSGSISLQEFIDAMHQFAGQSPDDKIQFLFKVYDIDGDGLIQHHELQHVMRACMAENGMQFSEEQIEDLTAALFEDADSEHRGAITYEALKAQLERHDGLLENLSISIDHWLVPPKPNPRPKAFCSRLESLCPYGMTLPYLRNNPAFISALMFILALNACLFASRIYEYRDSNPYVILSRACGQCLNLDCSLVLVLMLRRCLTFLRAHGFSHFLPIDQHIYIHKMVGVLILGFSIIHTIMHCINFSMVVVNDPKLNVKNWMVWEWFLTSQPGRFGLIPGQANPTGIALVFILLIMIICSHPFVRRKVSFEVFYWTHLLYVPFWILLIIHGPNFWKWFIAPGIIYLLERGWGLVNQRARQHGRTYISSGVLLPSRVVHLIVQRPLNFDFCPGDYVFVKIPAVARYEWHPFTISSAPEQQDSLWLHVRAVGQWTNRLYDYFEREQGRLHPKEAVAIAATGEVEKSTSSLPKETQNLITKGNGSEITQAMKDHMNPELERRFDYVHNQTQPLEMAFPSTQDKCVTQSSGYNHQKPTIIAFETPIQNNIAADTSSSDGISPIISEGREKPSTLTVTSTEGSCPGSIAEEGDAAEASKQRQKEETMSIEMVQGATHTEDHDLLSSHLLGGKNLAISFPFGKPLEITVDGPYGAPSSHIFRAQHAVLIGTGIGVTPFASILQSIMHRYWKVRHCCPNCNFSWASKIPPSVMHLRKVDFFWINRDQRSFEWFVNLLSQLEMKQAELGDVMERFLDMHMYITSALQKTDMKAIGLQLALDLLHRKEKRDLITGLKTRTNAGRPNWDKVFQQIVNQNKGKVTVFYCGPPQLGRTLRVKCDQFGFIFRKEVF